MNVLQGVHRGNLSLAIFSIGKQRCEHKTGKKSSNLEFLSMFMCSSEQRTKTNKTSIGNTTLI